jgi:hypothetical protein
MALLVAMTLALSRPPPARTDCKSADEAAGDDALRASERTFVYDAVARFNETLIGTIDAIDTALTATLAGDIALAVFTIDKIAELQPTTKLVAIGLLGASVLTAVAGYLFRFRAGVVDGIAPVFLIGDISSRSEESVIGAIETLVYSSERNSLTRFVKRVLTALATLLMVTAVIVLGVARLTATVVH